jgi:prepilin-type N-terminal cleavage/methylation domain-containing protein
MAKNQDGFSIVEILLALIAIAVIASLGWFVWHKKHGQTQGTGMTVTTQPDFSDNRTLQESGNTVSIDFAKCTPDLRRFDVSFGSTTIEVKGKEGGSCHINYGGEVENPNWDGKLGTSCNVPSSIGVKQFTKGNEGVDLSSISQYCST